MKMTAPPSFCPSDVFVTVVRALTAAASELESIEHVDLPAPKELEDALINGAAAIAVIKRIAERAPKDRKRHLAEMCRQEQARERRAPTTIQMLNKMGVLVLPEVKDSVNEALEVLRRRALTDPAVRDAMEEAGL